MIHPNDPALKSWLEVPADSDFPVQNIPFGIFKAAGRKPRPATRIGDTVIDLLVLSVAGYFEKLELDDPGVFERPALNDFIALGQGSWRAVRERLSELLREGEDKSLLSDYSTRQQALHDIGEVEMCLPVDIGDYTDFYSSIEHATNVGIMFRDPDHALLPNWKHIPVGYHGRASSIVISGTPIHRPKGQTRADDQEMPVYGPSRLMDFELEMAFINGRETNLGESVAIKQTDAHLFGMVLFNDLSARDIQKWEYVPLGPFLGKNFGSVISPWVVTLDALEPFRVEGPVQEPEVLPYLKQEGKKNYDIHLEVGIIPDHGEEKVVSRSNFRYMYWSMNQQLAHHTINGCNVRVGDMYASGTISGPEQGSYGSMLEISWKGTRPVLMPDGSERRFIHDNDTVVMRGYAIKNGIRVGFGEVTTRILPAL